MSRKFLYRRLGAAVILVAFLATLAPPGAAQLPQLKRPQDDSDEKPPEVKKKKVKGPRAIGLLQMNSGGKGSLIPIAILVDGKFYDASVYKADPIPMALETGTVYEVEQSGSSQGLFTVNGALHSKTQGSLHPWMGTGAYLPNGTQAAKTTRKAEDVPVGINTSDNDAPPRLTRGDPTKPAAASGPGSTPAGTAPSATPPATPGSSDKPTATPPSQPAGASTGGGAPGQDAAKPATPPASDKTPDPAAKEQAPKPPQTIPGGASSSQASPGQGSATQASPSQASTTQASTAHAAPTPTSDSNYRPTLRRGVPVQSAPEDQSTPTGPLQLVPAISDDGGPDPKPYKFYWKTGEEEDRRTQMLALAGDEVRAYAAALAKNSIPATPPAAKAASKSALARRKAPAKPVQPVFENAQFRVFDVWGNNQPVMIWSAEAHFPPAPGDTTAPQTYSITLVARTDIYGNLRKVYAGVTDKFHLDVTPRLELIDAVDADGDGRGELLFRETTDAGEGYVIYRPTADKLWKMFDSLGG